MKKIVALVLAMVMVLGLATTAFAVAYPADAEPKTLYTAKTAEDAEEVLYYAASEYVPGAENYLAHINDNGDLYFVGTKALYAAGGKKADVGVGKAATETDLVYNYEAKTFGAQKWSCTTDGVKADYSFVDENGLTRYADVAKGVTPDFYLLVGGKVVAAVEVVAIPAGHVLAVDANVGPVELDVGVYTAYCVACKNDVKISKDNINGAGHLYMVPENNGALLEDEFDITAAMPAGYKLLEGMWYVLETTTAPAGDAADDAVKSPQTFDAGIAMYVGMSVMAAAGSAVVLKKKD